MDNKHRTHFPAASFFKESIKRVLHPILNHLLNKPSLVRFPIPLALGLGIGGGSLRGSAIDLGLTPHQRVSAQGSNWGHPSIVELPITNDHHPPILICILGVTFNSSQCTVEMLGFDPEIENLSENQAFTCF